MAEKLGRHVTSTFLIKQNFLSIPHKLAMISILCQDEVHHKTNMLKLETLKSNN